MQDELREMLLLVQKRLATMEEKRIADESASGPMQTTAMEPAKVPEGGSSSAGGKAQTSDIGDDEARRILESTQLQVAELASLASKALEDKRQLALNNEGRTRSRSANRSPRPSSRKTPS